MPTAPSLRPPSFSASFRSVRPARSAGSAPARMPVRIDAASAKSSTRRRSRSRRRAGSDRRAVRRRRRGCRARAAGRRRRRRRPAPAPRSAAAGTRAPVRRRAPTRIAISLRRPSARAKSRLPTLAHAISSTSATAASSIDQRRADVADDHLAAAGRRCRPSRRSPADTPARVASRSPRSRLSPAPAWTPGFKRAIDLSRCDSRARRAPRRCTPAAPTGPGPSRPRPPPRTAGHHADDRVGLAVERQRPADDVGCARRDASSRTHR